MLNPTFVEVENELHSFDLLTKSRMLTEAEVVKKRETIVEMWRPSKMSE